MLLKESPITGSRAITRSPDLSLTSAFPITDPANLR
jgi:hypothetical protein